MFKKLLLITWKQTKGNFSGGHEHYHLTSLLSFSPNIHSIKIFNSLHYIIYFRFLLFISHYRPKQRLVSQVALQSSGSVHSRTTHKRVNKFLSNHMINITHLFAWRLEARTWEIYKVLLNLHTSQVEPRKQAV